MKKILSLAVLLFWGCPNPQTGKVDPYLTARTVITQAQTAVALSDGIFAQWMLGSQKPAEEKAKIQATYLKVKTAVVNGLRLAYDGVGTAEQAKEDPDMRKLMAEATKAWDSLRKFLVDLLSKDPAGVAPVAVASAPPPSDSGVNSKKAALTNKNPAETLPKKLY